MSNPAFDKAFDKAFARALCGDSGDTVLHKHNICGALWHVCTLHTTGYYCSHYYRLTDWHFTHLGVLPPARYMARRKCELYREFRRHGWLADEAIRAAAIVVKMSNEISVADYVALFAATRRRERFFPSRVSRKADRRWAKLFLDS